MRGQLAFEFMIFFFIFLVLVAIALTINHQKTEEVRLSSQYLSLEQVAEQAAFGVNNAFLQGDGYSGVLELPESLGVSSYNITINSSYVIVTAEQAGVQRKLMTNNVNGSIAKGENTILNQNGWIRIN